MLTFRRTAIGVILIYVVAYIYISLADNQTEAGTERRRKNIVARRKLVDLAKAQAEEVAILRAEVERLRMRTFPALVQVDP